MLSANKTILSRVGAKNAFLKLANVVRIELKMKAINLNIDEIKYLADLVSQDYSYSLMDAEEEELNKIKMLLVKLVINQNNK